MTTKYRFPNPKTVKRAEREERDRRYDEARERERQRIESLSVWEWIEECSSWEQVREILHTLAEKAGLEP
jgi:hypothetical protein